jgi:hypothetical protein
MVTVDTELHLIPRAVLEVRLSFMLTTEYRGKSGNQCISQHHKLDTVKRWFVHSPVYRVYRVILEFFQIKILDAFKIRRFSRPLFFQYVIGKPINVRAILQYAKQCT